MAEPATLRRALAAFLGVGRFRKFVQQGCRRGRLRYWQEQEWAKFTAAHAEFAVEIGELELALRICEVHGQELLPDMVKVFRGCVDYTREYTDARKQLFPHAASAISAEGVPFEGDRIEVWYCPACRQEETAWHLTRASG